MISATKISLKANYMGKKIISALIVVFTITFSYFMIRLNVQQRGETKVNEYSEINNNITDSKDKEETQSHNVKNSDIEYKTQKDEDDEESIENNEYDIVENDTEDTRTENEDDHEELEDEDKNTDSQDKKEAYVQKQELFKVSTADIRKKLTLRDKQKLMLLARKLSPFDYSRIKKDLYAENQEEGVKDALRVAKKRLSDEEYNEVKEILEEFINMDLVDIDT